MDGKLINNEEKMNHEKHEFWRYFVTVVLVVFFMIVTQILIFGFAFLIEGNLDILSYQPLTLLWVSMVPFGAALIVLLLCVRFLHKIPLKKFFTRKKNFLWKSFFVSSLLWFVLAILSDILMSFFSQAITCFLLMLKLFFHF